MSSFREVIFIDADSFFFVSPADLFEDEGYREKGALFFKDRNVSPESKRAWIKSILPPPISAAHQQHQRSGKAYLKILRPLSPHRAQ